MDFLIRAWKQNVRKPTKTLMVFLVMFVISNLMVTGLFILEGTTKATQATLQQITPIVYYTQDYDRFWRAMELGFIDEDETMPPISVESAQTLGTSKWVKAFDLSVNASVQSSELKAYVDPNNQSNIEQGFIDDGIMLKGGWGGLDNDTAIYEVVGTNSSEFKVASGTFQLVEGRGLNESDVEQEAQVVMIEERLAKANELEVGDKISVDFRIIWEETSEKETVPMELEIVGIFKASASEAGDYWLEERLANRLYMPYNVAAQASLAASRLDLLEGIEDGWLTEEEFDDNMAYYEQNQVSTIGFLLNDPLNVQTFISDGKAGLPSDYHTLKVANSTFDSIAKSVDSMTQTSNLIIYIVFGAGVLILSLITSLTLKSREYEIGVLLSLGESKGKVMAQFISELLMIAVVAFGLAFFSGSLLANEYGHQLLQTQMDNAMSQSDNNYIYVPDGTDTGTLSYLDFTSNFNIQLDPVLCLTLMGYGLAIVTLSAAVPMIFVMRYNPKTILTIR